MIEVNNLYGLWEKFLLTEMRYFKNFPNAWLHNVLNPSFKQVIHYKIKTRTELTEISLLQAAMFLLMTSKVKLKTECKKFHIWGIEKAFIHLIQATTTN